MLCQNVHGETGLLPDNCNRISMSDQASLMAFARITLKNCAVHWIGATAGEKTPVDIKDLLQFNVCRRLILQNQMYIENSICGQKFTECSIGNNNNKKKLKVNCLA